ARWRSNRQQRAPSGESRIGTSCDYERPPVGSKVHAHSGREDAADRVRHKAVEPGRAAEDAGGVAIVERRIAVEDVLAVEIDLRILERSRTKVIRGVQIEGEIGGHCVATADGI